MRTHSTIVRTQGLPCLELQSAVLVVVRGVDAAVEHELMGRPVVLGRARDADLSLRDPKVSRDHARLEPTSTGWRIRDLGSAGGTFVNGVRVESAELAAGQTIRVGDTELTLEPVARRLTAPPHPEHDFEGMVGDSPAMRELFGLVGRVAPLDLPVLLQGEPGTGKEGLARALHRRGASPGSPYEVVDCTLLASGEHLRSELFGHVKGAFSGADAARVGAFERAHGGTLFLDEIGELPPALQPQLLRVLQEGEVRPLGGSQARRVRVRVVAATNRDLPGMVRDGSFRADLFHRLAAVTLEVPPLRDRGEDLALLIRHLLPAGVAPDEDALRVLRAHPWPGNVRELGFVLQTAAALAEGGRLREADLRLARVPKTPAPARPALEGLVSDRRRVQQISDVEIREALAQEGGNRAAAARRLGMGRSTFFRRLREIQARDGA